MVNITERKGSPLVLNLSNKKVLRLFAYQTLPLSDALADSPEIVGAKNQGLISITKVENTEVSKPKKEVKNK